MANAIINGQNNVNEQNAANAATATPAPVAEQKEQQPPPFDYAPDVACNDAGTARFRCPTEKG